MTLDLKNIIGDVFQNRYKRSQDGETVKPLFYRIIGADDVNHYNDELSTIKYKCDMNKDVCIIFDNELPFNPDMELINYVFYGLGNVEVNSVNLQDIVVFNDENINKSFLDGLDFVINIASKKENFFSENVLKNFITKLIVWAYTYINNINFKSEYNPKCIYYGNIERHAIYFLMILYKMGFDVLYINPLKEQYFDEIEESRLSTKINNIGILEIESFEDRSKKGKVIDNIETMAKRLEKEITEELFDGTGMYKPWQFKNGYTKSVLLDGIVEDILVYLREPAKLRDGFLVNNSVVTVPCLFKKINGVYEDLFEYQKLVRFCKECENTLVSVNGNIFKSLDFSTDMFELMFSMLSDGTFDKEQVKTSKYYKLQNYSDEVQNLILDKFNELILSKDILKKTLTKNDALHFLCIILSLDDKIVKLIDNFDFTSEIPKIIIFLDNENILSDNNILLLAYFHLIGIDIVVFNPANSCNFSNLLNDKIYTEDRLDSMKYNITYHDILNMKKGFFSKLLDRRQ